MSIEHFDIKYYIIYNFYMNEIFIRTEKLIGEKIENNKYKYQSILPENFLTLIHLYT